MSDLKIWEKTKKKCCAKIETSSFTYVVWFVIGVKLKLNSFFLIRYFKSFTICLLQINDPSTYLLLY